MWVSLLDTSVILAVVAAVWFALRRWMPAQLGYCLFLLVLIKLFVPVQLTVPEAAAYLSPRHVIERFSARTVLRPPQASANRLSDDSYLGGDKMPGMMSTAGGQHAEIPALTPSPRLSLAAKLMCGWSMAVLTLFVWFTWAQARLARVLREASSFKPGSLPIDLPELKRLAGVARPIHLLSSTAVSSPAIGGLFRPCIVLPAGLADTLSAQQVRWVLLHELAHIRRHDLWVAALQRMVQITQFFNPAIWLANRMIDQQREYACDDAALAASATSRRECGAAFLSILDRATSQPARLSPALGIFSAKHSFRRRLMRILDNNRPVRPRSTVGSMAVLLALAVLLLPGLQAVPQNAAGDGSESNESAAEVPDIEETGQEQTRLEQSGIGGADHDAEAALKLLGANIVRNDDDEVVEVSGISGQLGEQELTQLRKLNWSPNRSSGYTVDDDEYARPAIMDVQISDADLVHLKGFTRLRTLRLKSNDDFTGSGLVHLKDLTNLAVLWINGSEFNDDGMVFLKDFKHLEWLVLYDNEITDEGLVHLKGLTQLSRLALNNSNVTSLEELKGLTDLKWLWLSNTNITDDGLVHLKGMSKLLWVSLDGTDITSDGLVHLKELPKLVLLHLANTNITDDGLVHLKDIVNLRSTSLANTDITDAGLVHLKGLSLEKLWLRKTKISDAGLAHLKELTSLEWLFLDDTEITDAGLAHLKELNKLATLFLDDITDAGLAHLKGLAGLKRLLLRRSDLSDEAVEKLHEALPECKIILRARA